MHARPGSCLVTISKQFKITARNFMHMQYMVCLYYLNVHQNMAMDFLNMTINRGPPMGIEIHDVKVIKETNDRT